MSLPRTTGGYGLGPGEGEALWFNGGAKTPQAPSPSGAGACGGVVSRGAWTLQAIYG